MVFGRQPALRIDTESGHARNAGAERFSRLPNVSMESEAPDSAGFFAPLDGVLVNGVN